MKQDRTISDKHVDVVDGIRALSVIIVLIFHFWQQTWIFPVVNVPFLKFITIGGAPLTRIDFTPLARVGYIFVDMMVLLSGFLLSLPLARCIVKGEPVSHASVYYKKRAVRILPSYLFCIVILFVYELATGGYANGGVFDRAFAARDLLMHLTFTHMLRVDTYIATNLDVVLWTLAVEVWFYILFPVIVRLICGKRNADGEKAVCGDCGSEHDKNSFAYKFSRRTILGIVKAAIVAAVLIGISHLFIHKYVLAPNSAFSQKADAVLQSLGCTIRASYRSSVINQLPAFFGVYGVGIIGAILYVLAARLLKRTWVLSVIATPLALVGIWLIIRMINDCSVLSLDDQQTWQVEKRLLLALIFMFFILSASLSAKWFRFLFSNKLMRFLSGISYNLYIWHQWLAVKLKIDWRIPFWEGDTPPNQLYDPESSVWKTKYAITITVAAFAAAILATYLVERPFADMLNGRKSIYTGKIKRKSKAEDLLPGSDR